ncbi:lipocalin family protein [Odoribacter laneus]|uniref:Lipocalin/cytosolic fatty-acid binding domain-containing protein n=1 Tax=Odoribacter laneus YIT 12061 TaxID=742817 RepID=H1DK05_9BACT|nr:lipocalin family protein [Odoribacter laneus]EHP46005.1 hypothetical protein HMPREF9449_02591 [Odoribacter laneus YIT 12061]
MTNNIDNRTVARLDLKRYMGKWYEIARFNHRFERGMDGVTAEYSLQEDGKIKVLNRGWKKGAWHLIKGKAKLPDKSQPGKLRVSFFPFIYSDYYVMELDEEHYSYAIVGSSSDKYLWILSRTKELSGNLLTDLLTRIRERGYDTEKLIFVIQ